SGFVIDDSGLIATSYHVVSQATQARVRFQDGSSFDVVGYAAVQPENDLAIVKLAGTPANLTVMQLSAKRDPPRLSAVIAIGHPHGVEFSPYDGRVSRVLRSSQLPRRSREFLSSVLSVKYDQRWIQHTARIAEGNSGGPLIDSSGQVVGVNTWVDESSHFGYALHVEHLAKLHAAATEEIEPLADHARRETRVARLLQDLSAEKIQQLYAAAAEFSFQPRSERQDETVSQLAWALTAANLPGSFAPSGVLEKHLDEVEAAADGVIAKLTKRRWDGPGQIALINELAVEKIARPLSGLMLVATVKRVVEGERGSRGMLLQLAGMGQTLFIPLDGVLFSPEPGESFLVIGVNYNGGVVRYGDNPLQLITAPLIASRTFIPLGK
ncbi:MAG: serine protease, partial [Pirellulaceae bacterium]|nr:serine protease [Pirellulaceae bacterium]